VAAVKAANIESMKLTPEDITGFNDSVKDVNFSKYPVDVWVAKGSKLISQVGFSTSAAGATYGFRVAMHDVNKPVHVTAPSGAKSLMDVLGGVLTVPSGMSEEDMSGMDMNPFSGISL
jgi:hypothetical protein